MSITDPFATAPAEEAAVNTEVAQAPTEAPNGVGTATATVTKTKPVSAESEGKVVLTFKGGTGYDAPWIVFHANGLQEAHDFLTGENSSLLGDVMTRVQNASTHFSGKAPAKSAGASGGGQSGGQPAASQEAPGGEKRFCSHGEMVFRSGVAKTSGKPYRMFACPERDRSAQCKAQFLN